VSFTVYAVLTPPTGATPADILALLNQTYYVSVALTPAGSGNLGSFTFDGSTVNATSGMAYGVPPIETLQVFDPGDLSKHGVYPTYFTQFGFTFNPLSTTTAYNSATSPGGLTPNPAGSAYYAAFTVDTSLLAAGYQLHFDLYNAVMASCLTTGCTNYTIDMFAPFSHDAETRRVPEPSSAVLMLTGLAVAARRLRRG
jgi:hypothetical protein